MEKIKIEKDSVQETLLIPLLGRMVCSERFPELFKDDEVGMIMDRIDHDLSDRKKMMDSFAGIYGALEVAQRQYDLAYEVRDYLKDHPEAAVVNLGCGLDTTFYRVDNGSCRGYNLDLPDVIETRNMILPQRDREMDIGFDLNDLSWFDKIDDSKGAVFIAAGVFYYFRKEEMKRLITALSERFKGGVLAFDSCNGLGLKMMLKTWIKQMGISDVGAYFALKDPVRELSGWSDDLEVSCRSYMRGYRNIDRQISILYRLMNSICDRFIDMNIVKIRFR